MTSRPAGLAPTDPAPRRRAGRSRRRRWTALIGGLIALASACGFAVRTGPGAGIAGDAGTHTVERRLLDDASVRWVGTFEGDPWDARWGFNWGRSTNAVAAEVPGVSRHGQVLDVTFNPDGLGDRIQNAAKMGMNRMAAFPLMGIQPLEEAFFRYYVYLPADWEAAADGKMPGLAGNVDVLGSPSDTSGGGAYDARSWSGRVMWNNDGVDTVPSLPTPRTYLYVASVGGESIDTHRSAGRIYGFGRPWTDGAGERVYMQLGEWNMIEVHYRMNTPGVEDGIFEGWLYNSRYPGGVRGAYHDNVQYRDAAHPDLSINQLQEAHYYGGAVGPDSPQHMYFDDYVISSAPIGPRQD